MVVKNLKCLNNMFSYIMLFDLPIIYIMLLDLLLSDARYSDLIFYHILWWLVLYTLFML